VSSAEGCPHHEEFSALLDRELAPERIPTLERHVDECESCRALFLRLAAADRMFGLTLPGVDLLDECLKAEPEKGSQLEEKLHAGLLELGRAQRLAALQEAEEKKSRRRRRRKLVLTLVGLLLVGAFAGSIQPSPLVSASAARQGAYLVGPGEVLLYRGAKVKLSAGARARFWCTFRWQRPRTRLAAGRLELLEGSLIIEVEGKLKMMAARQTAVADADGQISFEETK